VSNLIAAEVWRVSCLFQATRVVRRELVVARTAVAVHRIVGQALERFQPECRLRNLQMDDAVEVPPGLVIAGDEGLLVGAVSDAVLATIALVDGVAGARLTVAATSAKPKHVTFAVSQQSVIVPGAWFARAWDETWMERPGGAAALVAMLAVRETAESYGGRVAVSSAESGSSIAITLPIGGELLPGRSAVAARGI
jgi:hypothetical protein